MLENLNPEHIEDLAGARQALKLLLNLVEELKQENHTLRAEVQQLRDELNRLKGEQGKPDIKPSKKAAANYSSEPERRQRQPRRQGRKRDKIRIDREATLAVDPQELPADAEFKGYETVVIQDLAIRTDNVRFHKEKYYSASARQTYLAPLPDGYTGQFGPTVRALVIAYYYAAGMTEPKIVELLQQLGIFISAGQVSNLLIQKTAPWAAEAAAVLEAGLASTGWQHIDDTATRVNGENQYCHILCNPFYTWYATRPHKDRLTVLAVLQNSAELTYWLNAQTGAWLETFAVPKWAQERIAAWPQEQALTHAALSQLLDQELAARLNAQQQARVLEAAALTAYHTQRDVPVIPVLVSDDARQFRYLTTAQGLCWIHEGRHYKKLTPFVPYHRALLDAFLTQFWDYYHQLQRYRAAPTPDQAAALRAEFERLFSTETGYAALDQRIAATKAKQERLLTVLQHPEIPLHNNPAELGARQRVRKRDISFGPRTAAGRIAWDTFMSLAETAKKLGVSFFDYVYDRVSEKNALPSLADMIRVQSAVG